MSCNLLHRLSESGVKGTVLSVFQLDDTAGFLSRDNEQDIGVPGAGLGVGFYDPAALRPQKAQENTVIEIFLFLFSHRRVADADGFRQECSPPFPTLNGQCIRI